MDKPSLFSKISEILEKSLLPLESRKHVGVYYVIPVLVGAVFAFCIGLNIADAAVFSDMNIKRDLIDAFNISYGFAAILSGITTIGYLRKTVFNGPITEFFVTMRQFILVWGVMGRFAGGAFGALVLLLWLSASYFIGYVMVPIQTYYIISRYIKKKKAQVTTSDALQRLNNTFNTDFSSHFSSEKQPALKEPQI